MAILIAVASFANAQLILDKETIEDIVKNERSYFNDIIEVFNNDDPYLDIDDIALVYYGHAFTSGYNPGKDENEKLMKKHYSEDNYPKVYETAKKNIEGELSFDEAKNLIDSYYENRTARNQDDERTEEAEKVSSRIAQILSEPSFNFSPSHLIAIHKRL